MEEILHLMYEILQILRYLPNQLVEDFIQQQYV